MESALFDSAERLSAAMPPDIGRLRRSDPPFAVGQTAERHRALIADGLTVPVGPCGATVFDLGLKLDGK